ncbi:hypothetical protein [Apibacter sp. HY039]|uniref:hypothetical protein n=1 Tax=Apibacter sp. HY039 TaxID=2501476 RepID=UPI000FEC0723|nr:hypothetical protein [Apibacter sp. HY039]
MELNRRYVYQQNIEGRTKAVEVESDFKIAIKTEITYLEEKSNGDRRYFIKEVEYELVQYEDAVLTAITEMTNKICSIYKELDITVNRFGDIQKIHNLSHIKKEWEKVKDWLTNTHPLESFKIIRGVEFELTEEKYMHKNIQYMHFIYQYFFLLGRSLESGKHNMFKKNQMDQFGSGVVIPIKISSQGKDAEEGKYEKSFNSEVEFSSDMVKRLRESVKDYHMSPYFSMEGKYYFNKKKELDYSGFSIKEELGKNYSTRSYLEMKLIEII